MRNLILVVFLLIASCSNQVQNKLVESEDLSKQSTTINELISSGKQSYYLKVNQRLTINETEKSRLWQVSLGKRDVKLAIIEKYENNSQKSLQFTKIGTYQVKLGSHPSRAQGTIMMHSLTIIVN